MAPVIYMVNPATPAIRRAIETGELGFIGTPAQGNRVPDGGIWCADNGAFSAKWDENAWWTYLANNREHANRCLFAALPDVVSDWPATLAKSMPWVARVRSLGYRIALVLQDGATVPSVPWDDLDAIFIGGSTSWKLGPEVRLLVGEAKYRGLWVHMGRVNSERRLRYATLIGCDSADGTFLTYAPDANLHRVRAWLRGVSAQRDLLEMT